MRNSTFGDCGNKEISYAFISPKTINREIPIRE
jgi:hypothetical protein